MGKTRFICGYYCFRGLCGGFNSNICKLAKSHFKNILKEGKELKIITVGSKGHDQLKHMII